jgi:hypothetical protein
MVRKSHWWESKSCWKLEKKRLIENPFCFRLQTTVFPIVDCESLQKHFHACGCSLEVNVCWKNSVLRAVKAQRKKSTARERENFLVSSLKCYDEWRHRSHRFSREKHGKASLFTSQHMAFSRRAERVSRFSLSTSSQLLCFSPSHRICVLTVDENRLRFSVYQFFLLSLQQKKRQKGRKCVIRKKWFQPKFASLVELF